MWGRKRATGVKLDSVKVKTAQDSMRTLDNDSLGGLVEH